MSRPWFEHQLAPALTGVPEFDERLRRPGARILDVGCGAGWSTVARARAYPQATVVGVDVEGPSVEMARAAAEAAGLAGRVEFRHADGATFAGEDGNLDAAFAVECVHDMSDPVGVLRAVRRAVRPGAPVVVVDEAVADEFTAPGDHVERFMYGCSIVASACRTGCPAAVGRHWHGGEHGHCGLAAPVSRSSARSRDTAVCTAASGLACGLPLPDDLGQPVDGGRRVRAHREGIDHAAQPGRVTWGTAGAAAPGVGPGTAAPTTSMVPSTRSRVTLGTVGENGSRGQVWPAGSGYSIRVNLPAPSYPHAGAGR